MQYVKAAGSDGREGEGGREGQGSVGPLASSTYACVIGRPLPSGVVVTFAVSFFRVFLFLSFHVSEASKTEFTLP